MYMVLAVVAAVVVVVVGFCNNENTLLEPCSLCISMLSSSSSSTFSFRLLFLTLVECDDLGMVIRVLVLVCSASLKSCDP